MTDINKKRRRKNQGKNQKMTIATEERVINTNNIGRRERKSSNYLVLVRNINES